MARIRDLAEAALSSEQPAQNLESLVRDLFAKGETREAIEDELDAVVVALREAGADEQTEEVVLEILDRLRGWSGPDARM